MRRAEIYVQGQLAGYLLENSQKHYEVEYLPDYQGQAISLTMPITQRVYYFEGFPPFFDGVLPEGPQLEGLLKKAKLDRTDYFGQLLAVGSDLVGCVTVQGSTNE